MVVGGALCTGRLRLRVLRAPRRIIAPIALVAAVALATETLTVQGFDRALVGGDGGNFFVGLVSYTVAGRMRRAPLVVVVSAVVPMLICRSCLPSPQNPHRHQACAGGCFLRGGGSRADPRSCPQRETRGHRSPILVPPACLIPAVSDAISSTQAPTSLRADLPLSRARFPLQGRRACHGRRYGGRPFSTMRRRSSSWRRSRPASRRSLAGSILS